MHKILGHSEKVNQRHLWMHKILGHSEKVNQRHLWMHKILGHWEKESLTESQPSKLAVGSQIVSHILRMWRLKISFGNSTTIHNVILSQIYIDEHLMIRVTWTWLVSLDDKFYDGIRRVFHVYTSSLDTHQVNPLENVQSKVDKRFNAIIWSSG